MPKVSPVLGGVSHERATNTLALHSDKSAVCTLLAASEVIVHVVAPKPDRPLVIGIVTSPVVSSLTARSKTKLLDVTSIPGSMSKESVSFTHLTGTASVPVPTLNHLGSLLISVSVSVYIGYVPIPPLLPSGRSGAPSIGLDILLNVSPVVS